MTPCASGTRLAQPSAFSLRRTDLLEPARLSLRVKGLGDDSLSSAIARGLSSIVVFGFVHNEQRIDIATLW